MKKTLITFSSMVLSISLWSQLPQISIPSFENNNQIIQPNIPQYNHNPLNNQFQRPHPTPNSIQNYQQQQTTKQQQLFQEHQKMLQEIKADHYNSAKSYQGYFNFSNTNSDRYKKSIQYYKKAYAELTKMLQDDIPIDIKKAIWLVEDVVNQGSMTYEDYLNRISYAKKQVLYSIKRFGLNMEKDEAKHFAIQKLFSDTAEGTLKYDFNNYSLLESGFVTKLLKTGTGQCRSLPLAYIILAKELNTNANLALSPKHSYIRFNINGQQYNFETTCGFITSDSWVAGSGLIRAEAIKKKTFMNPISDKELIARLLTDLADTYRSYLGYDEFLEKIVCTSLKHFKHMHGYIELCKSKEAQFDKLAWKYNCSTVDEIRANPELNKKYNELFDLYDLIDDLGYSEMNKEQYENWLNSVEKEKKKSQQQQLMIRRQSKMR